MWGTREAWSHEYKVARSDRQRGPEWWSTVKGDKSSATNSLEKHGEDSSGILRTIAGGNCEFPALQLSEKSTDYITECLKDR